MDHFTRLTTSYPPTSDATIVQQVVFSALYERGFQCAIEEEHHAFQMAASGAFPEINLIHTNASTNVTTHVVLRSMCVGHNLFVYGRTKNNEATTSSAVTHKLRLPLSAAQPAMQLSPEDFQNHALFTRATVHLAYRLVPSCMPVADFPSLTMVPGVWIFAMQGVSVHDIGSLAATCKQFHSSLGNSSKTCGLWSALLIRDKLQTTEMLQAKQQQQGQADQKETSYDARSVYRCIVQERVEEHQRQLEKKRQQEERRQQQMLLRQREREQQRQFPPGFPGGYGGRGGRSGGFPGKLGDPGGAGPLFGGGGGGGFGGGGGGGFGGRRGGFGRGGGGGGGMFGRGGGRGGFGGRSGQGRGSGPNIGGFRYL
jgi:hypothetical protein